MDAERLRIELGRVVGDEQVIVDAAERDYSSQDISGPGRAVAELVARPGTVAELRRVVRAAVAAGWAVVPRGGGMSYSQGYTPIRARSVVLDLRRLDRVLEINGADRYVRVEAGCTWRALYAALGGSGFRTPFFGPLSGHAATVGGALSQHAAFFGSATHGGSGASVLGLAVVLASGEVLRTGGADGARPRTEAYGPDVTGLFLGDCGALGIKAEAVLALIPAPGNVAFGSFAFDTADALIAAQVDLAGHPGLSECFGFDPGAHLNLYRSGFRPLESLRLAGDAARAEAGVASKLKGIAATAVVGKRFVKDLRYSLHMAIESAGGGEAAAARQLGAIADIARAHGGSPIPDTIPRITRAKPFRPIKALLGPAGECWLPVHGMLRLTDAANAMVGVGALLAGQAAAQAAHGVMTSRLTVLSGASIVIEVHFFWPDRLSPFHLRHVTADQLQRYRDQPANPAGRDLVHQLRRAVAETLRAHGAWHMQIGKHYPYAAALDPTARSVLAAFKKTVDPKGLINPGALWPEPE